MINWKVWSEIEGAVSKWLEASFVSSNELSSGMRERKLDVLLEEKGM